MNATNKDNLKSPRLSKSGIEYLDYAWNFYSGCQNWKTGVCPVGQNCWARKFTGRFKQYYPNGFEPTFYPDAVLSPMSLKKPSIIGCAFMGDLFGDWMAGKAIRDTESNLWSGQGIMDSIFQTIYRCPHHKFLFLTKCPQNLIKFSPYPKNCWVGVTATDSIMFAAAYYHLKDISAKVKYISIEPLLDWDERLTKPMIYQASQAGVNWIIIGAQTKPTKLPQIEWVEEIVRAADNAGIPVFLKNNLEPICFQLTTSELDKYSFWERVDHDGEFIVGVDLRQEMPQGD